jgi:hypothetical protein
LLSLLAAAAGLWWFKKRDPLRPRVNVEQEVRPLLGPPGSRLLQVVARLTNVGEIPVQVREWRLWACPLDPLPVGVRRAVSVGDVRVENELEWESCAGGEIGADKFGEVRIRPGETQEVVATMSIRDDISAVRIYSFFRLLTRICGLIPAPGAVPGCDKGRFA